MSEFTGEFKEQASRIIQTLKKEIVGIRSNRPTPALVEDLKVNYYDKPVLLKQLCSISVQPPREIKVQVWEKSAAPSVVKAIESSGMGLSVNSEGNLIRVFLPELSKERRDELARHVAKLAESCRIQFRHLRDETNKKFQRTFDAGEITEDQKFKLKKEVQDETDKINAEIEKILNDKIKEIEN